MAQYDVDRNMLIAAIRRDCEVFLSFYMGDELTLEVPQFHVELWDEFLQLLDEVNEPDRLVGILQKLLGVPRGHSKTTLIKLAIILFFRYSRLSYCAYLSNTFAAALSAIKDISEWLQSPQEIELYGAPKIEKSSETDGLYILHIYIPNRIGQKRVIMKAFGQGTQLRGTVIHNKRPDLMIFDDVETLETAASETQQKKLDAWCFGTAMKAMAALGVCIFIGNMISETTLLARLSKDESWNATVFGAIIRDKDGNLQSLWPERWSLEYHLKDYATYRKLGQGHVWEAELMNLTAKEILGESLTMALRPAMPMAEELEAGFLCLDPAFGTNSWNDESAITAHGRMKGGNIPILLQSNHGRWKEEQTFDELISMSYRWGITTWVIEAQAAQRLLIPLFRTYMIQRMMAPELFLLLPIMAGKDSKASRIVSFRSSVAHGSYAIVEEEEDLVKRLEEYSPDSKVHDDVCDSAAYGSIIWPLHGTTIVGRGRQDVAGLLMGTAGGSTVGLLEMGIP
jgi:hypothetical protein